MKKNFVTPLIFAASASFACAFSLGGLVDSVTGSSSSSTETSASTTTSGAQTLIASQNEMLDKYVESKKQFITAYTNVLAILGNTDADKEAESIQKTVESNAKLDYKEATKIADDLVNKTSASAVSNIPATLSDSAKSKFEDTFGLFVKAIKGEAEVGQKIVEVSNQAKTIIKNGSVLERVELATSFDPTMELVSIIPGDLANMKKEIKKIADTAKKLGVDIPSSLSSLL